MKCLKINLAEEERYKQLTVQNRPIELNLQILLYV